MYKLYLITNLINYRRYAGITSQRIHDRFTQHCTQGYGLTNAIQKYGRENFKVELIASSSDIETIKGYEIKYIESLNLTDVRYGYNLAAGGDLTAHSESTKKKISAKLKGRKLSPEHRTKVKANAVKRGKLLKGKKRPKFSEEWKANMRKGSKGKVLSDDHKQAISNGIKSSEKYRLADKGVHFRTNNPSNNPLLKDRIARSKWKPVYCVNNGVCYLSLKSAAEDLSLRANAIATSLFRCTTIREYKFYYIYK